MAHSSTKISKTDLKSFRRAVISKLDDEPRTASSILVAMYVDTTGTDPTFALVLDALDWAIREDLVVHVRVDRYDCYVVNDPAPPQEIRRLSA